MFSCHSCEKSYSHEHALTRHVHLKHPTSASVDEEAYARVLVCNQCSAEFSRRDALKRHQRGHTGDDQKNCVICLQSMRKDLILDHELRCIRRRLLRQSTKLVADEKLPSGTTERRPNDSAVHLEWSSDIHSTFTVSQPASDSSLRSTIQMVRERPSFSMEEVVLLLREMLLKYFCNKDIRRVETFTQILREANWSLVDLDSEEARLLIHALAYFGDVTSVANLMLEGGVDINARNAANLTAVHCAVSGHFQKTSLIALQFLIDHGADLTLRAQSVELENGRVLYDATALAIASCAHSDEFSRCLLNVPSSLDIYGTIFALLSPLWVPHESESSWESTYHPIADDTHMLLGSAITVGNLDAVNEMVQAIIGSLHIDFLRNTDGETLLFTAVEKGSPEAIDLILLAKADINAQSRCGLSALHVAVGRNDLTVTKCLLGRHASTEGKRFYVSSWEMLAILMGAGVSAPQMNTASLQSWP